MVTKLHRWRATLWFANFTVTNNVTALQRIEGKSQIHVLLTPEAEACGAEGLFVFVSCFTCLFAHWKTVCPVRSSSARSIRSKTLTCKELLHDTDSESSSTPCIDPVGDLLPRSVTPCYYFFQITHFLHAQIDFWCIQPILNDPHRNSFSH